MLEKTRTIDEKEPTPKESFASNEIPTLILRKSHGSLDFSRMDLELCSKGWTTDEAIKGMRELIKINEEFKKKK